MPPSPGRPRARRRPNAASSAVLPLALTVRMTAAAPCCRSTHRRFATRIRRCRHPRRAPPTNPPICHMASPPQHHLAPPQCSRHDKETDPRQRAATPPSPTRLLATHSAFEDLSAQSITAPS
ncbi:hypothetical protein PVAP13_9KG333800 [Panicum virgatum]|uniref:Secreted protein n=1 Tax=Panicum virgatum TaxID=38727 RepID=A0A8T0NMB6_PANVG|nr:hypothetical protein PVAP13_9KG333800 [Panicum virgatum]